MDAVGLEVWSREAGEEMEVRWTAVAEGLREQGQDLRKTIAVPLGLRPVHRRRHQERPTGGEVYYNRVSYKFSCDGPSTSWYWTFVK